MTAGLNVEITQAEFFADTPEQVFIRGEETVENFIDTADVGADQITLTVTQDMIDRLEDPDRTGQSAIIDLSDSDDTLHFALADDVSGALHLAVKEVEVGNEGPIQCSYTAFVVHSDSAETPSFDDLSDITEEKEVPGLRLLAVVDLGSFFADTRFSDGTVDTFFMTKQINELADQDQITARGGIASSTTVTSFFEFF